MSLLRPSPAVWIAILASLALYAVSLFLPALEFADHTPVKGYDTLLLGWLGALAYDFPWYANLFYFSALLLVLLGRRNVGQLLCVLALAVGALSLWVRSWYFDESKSTPVQGVGSAFYCWMASFLVLALLLFLVRLPPPPPPPVREGPQR
jgi:hypothetical protein